MPWSPDELTKEFNERISTKVKPYVAMIDASLRANYVPGKEFSFCKFEEGQPLSNEVQEHIAQVYRQHGWVVVWGTAEETGYDKNEPFKYTVSKIMMNDARDR
jgi:hypothetical protein